MSLLSRHATAVWPILLLGVLVPGPAVARERLTVDRNAREVRFEATAHPTAMERPFGVKGHHAIVWSGGRSARWALFRSNVSDHDIRVALDQLGGRRGENLTPATWNEREDPTSTEPRRRVEGSRIAVFVEWRGSRGRVSLESLIRERAHARPSLDFRYGGHERFQAEFKSGCIVCLYSCPGGAIGNHARTIADYVRDGVVFEARRERLPRDGTAVIITLKIIP